MDDDLQFRERAFAWLDTASMKGQLPLQWKKILSFKDEDPSRRPLVNRPQGIFKPQGLAAALSIKSKPPEKRQDRTFVYDDDFSESGLIRYKWAETQDSHNASLRAAMQLNLPLIYFYGLAQGVYLPLYPVHVVGEDSGRREFLVSISETIGLGRSDMDLGGNPIGVETGYRERLQRVRLHQRAFRSIIMDAYTHSCAICSIRHLELLDAAHIVSDSVGGSAEVTNGISLCKIHHSAFDHHLIGVDRDYRVHLRGDLIHEKDGPMLKHGFQSHHGQTLQVLPGKEKDRPSRDALAYRFETLFIRGS